MDQASQLLQLLVLCLEHQIYSLQPISALKHPKFQETHAVCFSLAPQTSGIDLRTVSAWLLMHFRIELPDSENEHPIVVQQSIYRTAFTPMGSVNYIHFTCYESLL